MGERLEWVECPACYGTGGPSDVWDEDTMTWAVYVCSSCSGQGYRKVWVD